MKWPEIVAPTSTSTLWTCTKHTRKNTTNKLNAENRPQKEWQSIMHASEAHFSRSMNQTVKCSSICMKRKKNKMLRNILLPSCEHTQHYPALFVWHIIWFTCVHCESHAEYYVYNLVYGQQCIECVRSCVYVGWKSQVYRFTYIFHCVNTYIHVTYK